ncbi:MAG: FAD-binding protein [Bacteroides sp.]|nr:FAD-binding protein [Bacteroides sp.]
MISEIDLRLRPEIAGTPELLEREVARQLKVKTDAINEWRVTRRSVDARKPQVYVNLRVMAATGKDRKITPAFEPVKFGNVADSDRQVVIVGAGPAGLFAALRAIEAGIRPIVLERGEDVDSRRESLARINREKQINPESNYCFGEGGAGAFSDGKLFTRSKKRGNVGDVLALLVQFGASPEILVDSHPHIGSDRLPLIIASIRKQIIASGGEVRFNTKVTDLLIENGEVKGAETENGDRYFGPVVLATGHSARDVYRMLKRLGIRMEPKGIAMGVRLEHPQHLIDQIQYHSQSGRGSYLPAAPYSFVTQAEGRGVYSFCMCPGGVIVPAGTSQGELVVNGMSASARASHWANSGMVVQINPGDFPEYSRFGEFEMLELQQDLERRFFEAGGNSIVAPAQRMTDFVNGRDSKNLPPSSYLPGLIPARLDLLLPPFIADRLRSGFKDFGRKAKGFLTKDATMIGLESRTSAPVRIPRDKETMVHPEVKGLYPAGEGAGLAGGIVSAALDGQNCIDALSGKKR